jgi:hypothetical protein
MRPPGVPERWEDAGVMTQAAVLAFNQIVEHDELAQAAALVGAKCV